MPRPLAAITHALGLLVAVVIVASFLPPTEAPGPARPVVLHRDGDLVVVDAKAGARSAPARAGDGYAIYKEATLLDSYLIRLHTSDGIEQVRANFSAAATTIRNEVGLAVTVAPGLYGPTPSSPGTIDVIIQARGTCFGSWLGCTSPTIDDGKVRHAVIWLNPRLLRREPHDIDNTVRHELGHALGLAHYDAVHEGQVQTMHSWRFDATAYRSGDLDGLRHLNRARTGPPVLRTPTTTSTTTTTTTTLPPPPVEPAPTSTLPPATTALPPAQPAPPPIVVDGSVIETSVDSATVVGGLDADGRTRTPLRLPTGDDRSRLALAAAALVLVDVAVLVRRRRRTAP